MVEMSAGWFSRDKPNGVHESVFYGRSDLSSVVPVFRANFLGFSEHFQVAFLDPKGAVAQALDLIGVV